MSLLDDPSIPPETHDLARLTALEHLNATLWYFFAAKTASERGDTIASVARELREGVVGSMAEGQIPPAFLALMRAHAAKVMDRAVANAELADRLQGGNPG